MPFDIKNWKEKINKYLSKNKEGFKRGVYYTLCGATLLPFAIDFQDPTSMLPAMFALGTILSNLGSDLLAGKLQDWLGKKDPNLDSLVALLEESLAEDEKMREEMDDFLKAMGTVDQQYQQMSSDDKDWFQQTLQKELEINQSNLRVIYTEKYFEKLVVKNGDVIFGNKIVYNYNGKDLTPLVENYYRSLASRCQRLPLGIIDEKFIKTQGNSKVGLQDIYTDLDVSAIKQEVDEDEHHFGWRLARGEDGDREAILDAVAREDLPYIALLGNAGSGKTTFINYLTYRLLSAPKGLPSILLDKPIIQLVLRDVIRCMPPDAIEGNAGMLWNALKEDIRKRIGDDNAHKVLLALQIKSEESPCLLLLDGLDEIPEANKRRKCLIEAVEDLIASLKPGSRVILTARPYAYAKSEWRVQDFTTLTLKPFNWDQIQHFVSAWYQCIESPLDESAAVLQSRADSLKEAIQEKDYLGDLASRPILLTLMATLHTSHGTLPNDRAALYEDAVSLLMDRWQQKYPGKDQSARKETQPKDEVDPRIVKVFRFGTEKVRKVIESVAYNSHQKQQRLKAADPDVKTQSADITRGELEKAFSAILPDDLNPRVVVDYLEKRAALLIARELDIFIFPHRSFQEFLAACHLLNQPNSTSTLLKHIEEDLDWWREVYLLAVGRKKKSGLDDATNLITSLCRESGKEKGQISELDWMKAALAGEALLELRLTDDLQNKQAYDWLITRLRNWLTQLVTEGYLEPKVRLSAGDSLGHLGDFRKGVNLITHQDFAVPDIDWVHIPEGAFLMGSADSDKDAFNDEKPQHPVVLPGFWISRYPITNAQFAPFVEKWKGYENPDYWTKSGWAWRGGEDLDLSGISYKEIREVYKTQQKMRPEAKRRQPIYWTDSPWNIPNRPVVGVAWYEAHAYAQWLQHIYRQDNNFLPEGGNPESVITLPSEAEWEKAIRGTQGSIYPWGDTWRPDAANVSETDLGTTSPVGIFPQGRSKAFGLLDGTGNVWEWTRSLWSKDFLDTDFPYPYDPQDPAREDIHSDQLRVVRGGSFYSYQNYARCAIRNWFDPDLRDDLIGFRLCLRP